MSTLCCFVRDCGKAADSRVELSIGSRAKNLNLARGYGVLSILALLLTLAFLPMLIRFELMHSPEAVTSAQRMVLAVSLAIYFAILIIPGRGLLKRRQARWLTAFLLIMAGLLIVWGMVLVPAIARYFRTRELLSDTSLIFISRLALMQAVIGMLALGAKAIALAIPYVKRMRSRLSELTWFR